MQTQIQTVPFHGANLVTILHNNEPYAAMKPIVEGMGLAWQVQHRKITENNDRFCVTEMVMQMPGDDQNRNIVMMPVRKLPGWLMTIHPNKIKNPDVRARVVMYQNECDDVLWQYWQAKQTALPRQYPGDKLTPAQLRTLQEAVAQRTEGMTDKARAAAFPKLWGALKSHFHVPSYRELPPEDYDAALSLIGRLPLDGEYLPAQTALDPQIARDLDNYLKDYGFGVGLALTQLRNLSTTLAALQVNLSGIDAMTQHVREDLKKAA